MTRFAAVAMLALLLGGCASAAVETRSEDLTIGPVDEPWVLKLQAIAQGGSCMLGMRGAGLVNNGKAPLGGGFLVAVSDEGRSKTIGELNLTCDTAAPGGSAACAAAVPLTFRCQFVHINARSLSPAR